MTNGTVLVPELAEHVRQAEAQKSEVTALAAGLSQAQFDWRPTPKKWSVGEHIEHLTLTARPYLAVIEASTAQARAAGELGPGPYRYGWLGNWFARFMEPPPRLRVKTLRALEPHVSRPKGEVVQDFLRSLDELITSVRSANGVDLGRATFRSPFMKLLKLSVGQGFVVLLAHNRRHLWHVRQVLTAPGFPSS